MVQLWEIVGGEDKGGIIVREGQPTISPQCEHRISTGALVEEIELAGGRLHYRKRSGTGPEKGWISVSIGGKELARRITTDDAGGETGPQKEAVKAQSEEWNPYKMLGVEADATDAQIKSAFRKRSLKVHPDQNPDPDAAQQFQQLSKAKEFLLNPFKRLMYNMKHGLQARRHYVQWWSTWDEIFEEIDPAEDGDEAEALPSELSPAAAPSDVRTDVLVFGATGLVGTLVCSLLRRAMPNRTWAIAGRDERKLGLLEEKFGKGPQYRGKLLLQSPEYIDSIVRTARLVIDCTGPKFIVGCFVAEACVRTGTHYIENTGFPGDTVASKTAYDKLDDVARDAGVSLLYFCGIGSVLFDFGSWLLVQHLRQMYGLPTRRVDAYEISHGTFVSGTIMLVARGEHGKEPKEEKFEAKLKKLGYFFLGGAPKSGLKPEDDEDKQKPVMDPYAGMWANQSEIPELITVRCSYGLASPSENWGDNFRFKIWMLFPDEAAANLNSLRMGNRFLRRGYEKHVEMGKIPAPGQGPCERLRKEAVCTRILVAEADEPGDGRKVHLVLNPGPGGFSDHQEGTASALLEAGACMLDVMDGGCGGQLLPGFGTPTYHLARFGFLERLAARGYPFKVEEGAPARSLFHNFLASAASLSES